MTGRPNRPALRERAARAVGPVFAALAAVVAGVGAVRSDPEPQEGPRVWLAGDHHIHSRFSVGWDESTTPPTPILGGDAIYAIPKNAEMARAHGLAWMVATDHGGPHHSKVNLELAYPELLESRRAVPEVIQFFGMELDTPGAEHSSLIVPHTHDEHLRLHDLESRFARREPFPPDPAWHTEERMLEALREMRGLEEKPVVIVNHPSRSATGLGVYGANTPRELRNWNDAAPEVAVGMEGAPGHQAAALRPDGTLAGEGARGSYDDHPTLGGFDQMTARLGGFWDAMLGEGRRWWITATSDSHVHWREGGADFWPGEYSKTYVLARREHADILDAIRAGRVFVTTGDLVTELDVTAQAVGGGPLASIGGALRLDRGDSVRVVIRARDPEGTNHGGRAPTVARIDLIAGDVTGPAADRERDQNPTARVVARFTSDRWTREGEILSMEHVLVVRGPMYLRVRGTSTGELEPLPDPPGEDPWEDLWFYANPVFLEVR